MAGAVSSSLHFPYQRVKVHAICRYNATYECIMTLAVIIMLNYNTIDGLERIWNEPVVAWSMIPVICLEELMKTTKISI